VSSPPSSDQRQRGRFWLGLLVGLVIAGLIGVALVAPIALMHHDAGSLETAYGSAVVGLVSRYGGTNADTNPVASSARTLEQGRESYTGSCSQCHGGQGDGRGVFGQTSFPPATDLTSASTRNLSDGQIFYIIKNGLGFTAMPAYSSQFSDQEIWTIVTFVRALQGNQAPLLAVPTPTGDQLSAVGLSGNPDAQRGAVVFAAEGCAACHTPTGPLSINPANDVLARIVRGCRPGMPCYTPDLISDDQVRDLQAYVATLPATGFLGGPEDRPPAAAGGSGAQNAPSAGGASPNSGASYPCSTTSTGSAPSPSPSPSPAAASAP
jgi:mono/diheme cytochrome c family protein